MTNKQGLSAWAIAVIQHASETSSIRAMKRIERIQQARFYEGWGMSAARALFDGAGA
jgi:hypothetical protein